MFLRLKPASVVLVAFVLLCANGCGDSSSDGGETACCDSAGPPIFLKTKLDDDDGDGNPYDEDFPAINDEDDDIADHAWIRDDDGVYHLFFQNEDHGSGSDIEHYTSTNLRDLAPVGLALTKNPGGWDSYGLWAPHIVKNEETYFMFYTGTDGVGPDSKQRIGLATSTDLVTWKRFPGNSCAGTTGDGCLYECDEGWTTWGASLGSYNQQCRDPFVVWDDSHQHWVMFATAKSTNQWGVITVAYSENLTQWQGAGYIDATRRLAGGWGGQPTGGQAENAHVMSYDGTHYLLFTDWQDPEDSVSVQLPRTITQYATSSTLEADSSGSQNWVYRGYIPDPGVNALEVQRIHPDLWVMSQSISNESSGDYEHRRTLRLKCVLWDSDLRFQTANFGIRRILSRGGLDPVSTNSATPRRSDHQHDLDP